MARARSVAGVIGALALLAGWAFLQTMSVRAAPADQPYVETLSFALSTPAGLVFLSYLTAVFEFEAYYEERGYPGLFGDFFLSVLTAAAVGLPVTAVVLSVTPGRMVLFTVASLGTFVGGFGCFFARTRSYFQWEPEQE